MPYAGKYQLTPEDAMVAKVPVDHGETDDATAMSYGFIPAFRFSPFHGEPMPWWKPFKRRWAQTP